MKQIKPYLFIIGFLILPLLLVPLIKYAKNSYYTQPIEQKVSHETQPKYGLVLHGGAGNITKERLPDSIAQLYTNQLNKALDIGYQLIELDSSASYVVTEVIKTLENSLLFNAGKGSVFAANGNIEMDASIMDGKTLQAGAVSGVKTIKNPIKAALLVMNHSEHVLLSGSGADNFAMQHNLDIVDRNYFSTKKQKNRHLNNKYKLDKHGTVGCAVLDKSGNLAAGTSTGGMANKKFGRIGDSPIIGAGTYANNNTCAVSCTGHGEYFIRLCIAYQVSSRMKLLNESLATASLTVLNELTESKGTGGFIALDRKGNYTYVFNTPGMFRAVRIKNGDYKVELFQP